jgi:hypothetical protein
MMSCYPLCTIGREPFAAHILVPLHQYSGLDSLVIYQNQHMLASFKHLLSAGAQVLGEVAQNHSWNRSFRLEGLVNEQKHSVTIKSLNASYAPSISWSGRLHILLERVSNENTNISMPTDRGRVVCKGGIAKSRWNDSRGQRQIRCASVSVVENIEHLGPEI